MVRFTIRIRVRVKDKGREIIDQKKFSSSKASLFCQIFLPTLNDSLMFYLFIN
jgi:hypothetical protein